MSALCREVVTLQLGHYSNFVGTHWWNLQDASLSYDPDTPPGEIQSDAVFREGQTLGGSVTYTPRLIAMDLKGSLRSLRLEGSLYDSGKDASAVTWEGSLMMHKQSPPSKNSFLEDLDKLENGDILAQPQFPSSSQQPHNSASFSVDTVNSQLARRQKNYRLEGSVKVWSDFLRIHLHPRTISVLQYNHDGEFNRLEAFGQGEALLQGALLEELEDKLHFFIEECDYFQGFQVLCDIADGFAGLGSKVTEMLRDTYGGRGILTWGMAPVSHPNLTTMKNIFHVLNCTLGTLHMANNSSLFCPLTLRGGLCLRPEGAVAFPYVNYDPSLWYHSSSLLALGLDALTLPYRMRNNSVPMWQLADSLTGAGRKVAAAFGAIPFPMMQGGCLPDALHSAADVLPWQPMSACLESENGRCYGQWAVLKGFEGQRLVSSLSAGTPPPSPLHSVHSGEDVLASYIRSFYPNTPLALQLAASPSKLTPPFPRIFSSSLSDQGFAVGPSPGGGASAQTSWVSSVPVLTSLQSGPNVGSWLSEMRRDVTAFDVRRVAPSFLTQGLEMADYQEALEQLRLLARCYRDDSGGVMQSSSEEDDDDDD